MTTFKLFADKMGGTAATNYIGNTGEIFYDPTSTTLRISDGETAGGNEYAIGTGGGTSNRLVNGASQLVLAAEGDITLPQNGGIVFDRANTSIRVGMGFHIASGEGIDIQAIDQTDPDNLIYKNWYFGTDGTLTIPGSIIPDANIAYDLGSDTKRFRDLYLSGNTINLGGSLISASPGGGINIPGGIEAGYSLIGFVGEGSSVTLTFDPLYYLPSNPGYTEGLAIVTAIDYWWPNIVKPQCSFTQENGNIISVTIVSPGLNYPLSLNNELTNGIIIVQDGQLTTDGGFIHIGPNDNEVFTVTEVDAGPSGQFVSDLSVIQSYSGFTINSGAQTVTGSATVQTTFGGSNVELTFGLKFRDQGLVIDPATTSITFDGLSTALAKNLLAYRGRDAVGQSWLDAVEGKGIIRLALVAGNWILATDEYTTWEIVTSIGIGQPVGTYTYFDIFFDKPLVVSSFSPAPLWTPQSAAIINGDKTVRLDTAGDLTLPGGIVFDRANTSIRVGMGFHIASGEGIDIQAIDQTDPDNLIYKNWYFSSDGTISFPDSTLDAGSAYLSIISAGPTAGIEQKYDNPTANAGEIQSAVISIDDGGASIYVDVMNANSYRWTFGTEGKLTLPGAMINSTVAKTGGASAPTVSGIGDIVVGTATLNGVSLYGVDAASGNFGSSTGPVVALFFANEAPTPFTLLVLTPGTYTGFTVTSNGLIANDLTPLSFIVDGVLVSMTPEEVSPGTDQYAYFNRTGDVFSLSTKDTQTLAVSVAYSDIPSSLTAINLRKSINKLTSGEYSLADGVEGQIMYMVPQNGITSASSVTVVVANGRAADFTGVDGLLLPFKWYNGTDYIDSTGMCTLIFTDGAWQQQGGAWD